MRSCHEVPSSPRPFALTLLGPSCVGPSEAAVLHFVQHSGGVRNFLRALQVEVGLEGTFE